MRMVIKPLAIDLYAGLGGWTEGLLAEGFRVVGFDIERHKYGDATYPAQLVIQDVLTLHGRQFKSAALIVASPPCQAYSYMSMPWSKAKAIEAEYLSGVRDIQQLNALFDACFRIQREAIAAAGHFIPLVVENVRGAQKWVGRAQWNYGSFYLWGDVPALMPIPCKPIPCKVPGFRFDGSGRSFQTASVAVAERLDDAVLKCGGVKCGGTWFGLGIKSAMRQHSSKSPARKMASAMIAKIPLTLSRHIAASYRP